METITARNVNDAFVDILWRLDSTNVIQEETRNGLVYSFTTPVATTYLHPRERILWLPERDANPFFHLMESIWMLAGRNDLRWILDYNSRMKEYAEENGVFHGAYGFRWREHFANDQLLVAVDELKSDPKTRRCVIQMWDAPYDLGMDKRDLPCNTAIYFRIVQKTLSMTVVNRSNDILWGAYGANAVHFSVLQEVIANALELPVGEYVQFSNNMHGYVETISAFLGSKKPVGTAHFDAYRQGILPYPRLLNEGETLHHFLWECEAFCDCSYTLLENKFLTEVAKPMQEFYLARKAGEERVDLLTKMPNCDWKLAALDWYGRRLNASK